MEVNVAALRQFQAAWGPVLDAIPAVIEMAERKSDLDSAVAAKKLELEKTQAEIEAAYKEADVRLEKANQDLTDLADRKVKLVDEVQALRSKMADEIAAAEAERAQKLANLEVQIGVAQGQIEDISGEYALKRAAAEAEHVAVLDAMKGEIAELAARKAEAEAALQSLKAKLG